MLDARRVCYSTGPSGDHLKVLCQTWGFTDSVLARALVAPPGMPVATLVANGEADLGFQQLSELISQPGVEVVGPLPPEIQAVTVFSAGVASKSADPEAAHAFVAFMTSAETAGAKRRYGMEPAWIRRGAPIIIDCHGHYTTAPKPLEAWRNRQIAGIKDPALAPKVAELKISDDELRELIEFEPAAPDEGARMRSDHLQPARQLHGPSHRRFRHKFDLGLDCMRVHFRPRSSFPTISSARRCCRRAPASIPRPVFPSLRNASGTTASSPSISTPIRPAGSWTSPPLTDRWWYPFYEKMVELDVPAMVHVSSSPCNPNFHATGAHYINGDTSAFMQFLTSSLFKDFPTLKFIIPHGGGAVPGHWGRYRGLAQDMKLPPLSEHLLGNVFFDTCVYHQPGGKLLTKVIPIDNILFAIGDGGSGARHRSGNQPSLR